MAMGSDRFLALFHPADVPTMTAAFTRLEETGQEEMEVRLKVKSGDYRCLSVGMRLTRDGAGLPLYRYGNVRDITERKRVEEALRVSNVRYSTLFANKLTAWHTAESLLARMGDLSIT